MVVRDWGKSLISGEALTVGAMAPLLRHLVGGKRRSAVDSCVDGYD
jgi:hypothetical protein